jgi:nucleoside-diphosphate kinase
LEISLVLIKPDAVKNKHVGNIISIYEKHDFQIDHIKILIPDELLLSRHYEEHKGKDFYGELIQFMRSDRVVALVLTGKNIVNEIRKINGSTNPFEAEEGTIRKAYGTGLTMNAVHASASIEAAEKEISIWFQQ